MDIFTEKMGNIKESILKFVPAKYIYLFGSHAYGNPTEESDIDIYVVTPDYINNFSELYAKIIGDLGDKKIFFVDLLLGRETAFNSRKKRIFSKRQFVKRENYYMNNENVKEWLQLANDDLYSAKILNEAVRKPYEIICYHCAQSIY
jgi:predicted nucleotidyltransferase